MKRNMSECVLGRSATKSWKYMLVRKGGGMFWENNWAEVAHVCTHMNTIVLKLQRYRYT